MGYSPGEMIGNQRCWSDHLHPEDAARVFEEMRPLIQQGGGTVEYRFQHRDGHYIWIQDTFKVVKDEAGKPSNWSAPGPISPNASRSKPSSTARDSGCSTCWR